MELHYGKNILQLHKFIRPIYNPPLHKHSHSFFEISYVLHGTCENVINKNPTLFKRGVCTILRPSDNHFFRNIKKGENGYQHIDIYIDIEKFKQLCDCLSPTLYETLISDDTPIIYHISHNFLDAINNRVNLLITQKADLQTLEAFHSTLIVDMLSAYLEEQQINKNDYPSWIKKILLDLNSIETMSMSINELARKYGYSPDHLSREFKRHTGIKLSDYIMQTRINYSLPLLKGKDMKIIDIALLIGYQKHSTFSANFKTLMHCTPKEYQNDPQKNFLV